MSMGWETLRSFDAARENQAQDGGVGSECLDSGLRRNDGVCAGRHCRRHCRVFMNGTLRTAVAVALGTGVGGGWS